ncbi:MAG: ribose-phosphate pyrophosphokinase [Verrucomicrobia bacterium]|nr:ribose-phosphate pyrophosphokinase [Verrucomicrobiota bacterium]MBU4246801.1 ribose-phosphate pyrophosphokinase [Verrucomicrobiota bacterium]MBU4290565.1 ribose-phosphate pyrophosphokinase [Verrucomicrobiota bacterium]MBU4496589.1 ribose-phosphate pyrophosphokinase [Verrucomicrobiota bacterium]MCG2681219.1 ribose-phosphate pyrophosphokinase [Kiritimatiellia bacterium]
MKIFTGTANPKLAEGIAKNLGIPLGDIQIAHFPDGEISVKVAENIRGRDVFMIQPICYPPNEHLMELLIVIDAMRRASAARITAVVPFYGYGRQDRKDQPRVPITAKLVANLLVAAGVNRLLTMDLHTQQIQGFFDIPVDHLCAAPVMVKPLREKGFDNLVIVSPDPGGMKMAYQYSRMLNSGLAIVAKQRTSPNSVETYHVVGDVDGRTAVLVDDLVTTGGTLCAAADLLKKKGARDIYAMVTHAVMIPEAFERLSRSAIKEFIVTDSVPLRAPTSSVSIQVLTVADLLAEAIRRIHNNQSVSSLFNI